MQQFLKNYVVVDQQDRVDHLELVEFCYNNLEHSTIGATPFQMVMSKSPIVPTTWAAHGQPPMMQVMKCLYTTWWGEAMFMEMAKVDLEKVHKRYKDFVNKFWQEVNFEEEDEVWLNINKFRLLKGLSHKFLGSIQSVGKEFFWHFQTRTTRKP